MTGLTSEQPIATYAQPNRQRVAVIAGLCSGVFTTIGLIVIVPHYRISPFGLLIRALVYSIAVFTVSGATALLCLGATNTRSVLALRTASTAIWLAPLATFGEQESWFAIVLWIVFCWELVRLAAFVRKIRADAIDQHAGLIFVFPKPNWKPFWFSLAGAFLCQAAMAAWIDLHSSIAVLLMALGTIPLIWRGIWMIEASPPTTSSSSPRQPLYLVIVASWLIILSWLSYILSHGEGGSLMAIWSWRLFATNYASAQSDKHDADKENKSSAGAPAMPETVFPGVILYPKHQTRTVLVAPPAQLESGPGTESEPLSIPFNGVYWLWQPPRDRPPLTAVLQYGSPAVMGFHTADGSQLWMEAHQNLVKPIGLDCCNALQIVIDNADSHPKAVAVELLLRNTTVAGKPFVSLGRQNVAGPVDAEVAHPVTQTLTFPISSEIKRNKFDELKVEFRLDWWRGDKSAKIAITRFVLIPGR